MKAIRDFLKKILTLQTVWVDETHQGHWVQKKRMHPALRMFIGGGVAVIAVVFAVSYFYASPSPDFPLPAPSSEKPEQPPQPIPVTALSPDEEPSAPLAIIPDAVRPALTPNAPAPAENLTPEAESPSKGQPMPKEAAKPSGNPISGRRKDYWIHIDKGNYTLSLYRGQDVVKTYSVAVGKNPGDKQEIGDHRTPVGDFRVVSIENASKWKHDFGDGKGKIAGAYGPWFIRLDAGGWKGIGIHGTHDPDSRGTMATEGCIRLSNEEIQDLKRYAYRNMRVVIEE